MHKNHLITSGNIQTSKTWITWDFISARNKVILQTKCSRKLALIIFQLPHITGRLRWPKRTFRGSSNCCMSQPTTTQSLALGLVRIGHHCIIWWPLHLGCNPCRYTPAALCMPSSSTWPSLLIIVVWSARLNELIWWVIQWRTLRESSSLTLECECHLFTLLIFECEWHLPLFITICWIEESMMIIWRLSTHGVLLLEKLSI